MTQRLLHFLASALLAASMLTLAHSSAHAAEGIEIAQAHLESTEEGYKLSATFAFELNHELENAIVHGVPLYFKTDIELNRPRWYWFDERAVSTSQTIRISYNVFTRQYNASITGGLQQSFSTLDDALSLVRRPSRWVVAEPGTLKAGQTYHVSMRMELDPKHFSKPFQVHAINNSDWRLSSDWISFSFKAE